jgi:hypothetical protein
MIFNKNLLLTIFFLALTIPFLAQSKESKWSAGVSYALAKYTPEQSKIVGYQFVHQAPRVDVSRYLTSGFSLNAGLAMGQIIDPQLNKYTTLDATVRYDFNRSDYNSVPYLLIGVSSINALISSSTLNFGAGNTLWFSQQYGVNFQAMLRYSSDKTYLQKSHKYFSVGIVYSLSPRPLGRRLWGR